MKICVFTEWKGNPQKKIAFGVFIGIFAMVVVMMLSVVTSLGTVPLERAVLYIVAVPAVLAGVILLTLWGIRKLILASPS